MIDITVKFENGYAQVMDDLGKIHRVFRPEISTAFSRYVTNIKNAMVKTMRQGGGEYTGTLAPLKPVTKMLHGDKPLGGKLATNKGIIIASKISPGAYQVGFRSEVEKYASSFQSGKNAQHTSPEERHALHRILGGRMKRRGRKSTPEEHAQISTLKIIQQESRPVIPGFAVYHRKEFDRQMRSQILKMIQGKVKLNPNLKVKG